jgi:hypothetical protein
MGNGTWLMAWHNVPGCKPALQIFGLLCCPQASFSRQRVYRVYLPVAEEDQCCPWRIFPPARTTNYCSSSSICAYAICEAHTYTVSRLPAMSCWIRAAQATLIVGRSHGDGALEGAGHMGAGEE